MQSRIQSKSKSQKVQWIALGLLSMALAACSSTGGKKGGAMAPVVNGEQAQTSGVASQGDLAGASLAGQGTNGAVTGPGGIPASVYFGFNKFNLDATATGIAKQNATYLLQHPDAHVMIAGNTDPRGSQDYNFHLGQRRADAVKNYLLAQGIAAGQLCTVSYGELKPAATPAQFNGDWQKAYSLDRRGDILYGQTCEGQAGDA